MKYRLLAIILITLFTIQCKQKQQDVTGDFSFAKKEAPKGVKASTTINLESKGIGPIESVSIGEEIDEAMASRGKEIYEQKCNSCHRVGSTFIGPPPNGILERRTPEWVMNMILNPGEMVEKDSLAKALFMEFNGQMMTNQNVTVEEARSMLEYFRTLDL